MPSSRRTPVTARLLLPILLISAPISSAQVLEFWSNGLKYQALTRLGLTVMHAPMPHAIRDFGVLQVAMNNGSKRIWRVKPTDFVFLPADGRPPIRAVEERVVIADLFRHAGRSEVVKLQAAYEQALFGNQHIRSNNGYEQRRISALALGNRGVKAAAAASALTFVQEELSPGDSTDGAVFFPHNGQPLGPGKVVALINGQVFEFRNQ